MYLKKEKNDNFITPLLLTFCRRTLATRERSIYNMRIEPTKGLWFTLHLSTQAGTYPCPAHLPPPTTPHPLSTGGIAVVDVGCDLVFCLFVHVSDRDRDPTNFRERRAVTLDRTPCSNLREWPAVTLDRTPFSNLRRRLH